MGVDDLCHNRLVLGLGLSPSAECKSAAAAANQRIEPSILTLRLSAGETFDWNHPVYSNQQLAGQDGAASSLSKVSVKREREEVEVEKVSSRVSDEDDDVSNGRKKLRLTKAQSALLEESFKHHSTLNPKQKQELAKELKLRPRQVEVWFQNRRARTKLKQTEVEYELLKKCCEKLTDENRRLHKELQALKFAQPMYMQLPAATLTMCPFCESIGATAVSGNAAKSSFAKLHFYRPFTNPSAAF